MSYFSRRRWLASLGLGVGGLSVSHLLPAVGSAASPAQRAGVDPARLSLNENPYGPSPAAVAAIQREFGNLCRYTGVEYDALVSAIAAREAIPPEQIILGEILEPLGTHLSLQGGVGGEFIYSDPGYTALIDSAVAVGGRAVGVPLGAQMENDLPAILAKVNERTRAVFLVNPHNPTGIVSEADQLTPAAPHAGGLPDPAGRIGDGFVRTMGGSAHFSGSAQRVVRTEPPPGFTRDSHSLSGKSCGAAAAMAPVSLKTVPSSSVPPDIVVPYKVPLGASMRSTGRSPSLLAKGLPRKE